MSTLEEEAKAFRDAKVKQFDEALITAFANLTDFVGDNLEHTVMVETGAQKLVEAYALFYTEAHRHGVLDFVPPKQD